MRTLGDSDRNTLSRGWVRQAVMGVLRWKELPAGRNDTINKGNTLQVVIQLINYLHYNYFQSTVNPFRLIYTLRFFSKFIILSFRREVDLFVYCRYGN